MNVSVVMSCFNRAKFMSASFASYLHQTLPLDQLEIICVDDGSDDETADVVRWWSGTLPIVYIRLPRDVNKTFRAGSIAINYGVRASSGELVIATHPEVLVGRRSLELMYAHRKERTYHVCKAYYLTPRQQSLLDTVDLEGRGPLAVRDLPGFYDDQPVITGANGFYAPRNVDLTERWENNLFSGGKRSYWQAIGGYYPFQVWGAQDIWCYRARITLGIANCTEMDEETICVHQNHDAESGQYRNTKDAGLAVAAAPYTATELWK